MRKFPAPRNKLIQQVYGDIETAYRKKRQSKHKLTKREFIKKMKGDMNDTESKSGGDDNITE